MLIIRPHPLVGTSNASNSVPGTLPHNSCPHNFPFCIYTLSALLAYIKSVGSIVFFDADFHLLYIISRSSPIIERLLRVYIQEERRELELLDYLRRVEMGHPPDH